MSNFKVLSIPSAVAQKIREKMVDNLGHELSVTVAGDTGYGPCRSCLKQFRPGEKRILFSYSPNDRNHPYNEIGPIFIHAEACPPYEQRDKFPPEIKNGRLPIPLALRGYNNEGRMIGAALVGEREVEEVIAALFENRETSCIHARNAEFGCFIAHIERA